MALSTVNTFHGSGFTSCSHVFHILELGEETWRVSTILLLQILRLAARGRLASLREDLGNPGLTSRSSEGLESGSEGQKGLISPTRFWALRVRAAGAGLSLLINFHPPQSAI